MAINDKNIPITIIFRCRERGAFRGGSVMVWCCTLTTGPLFWFASSNHAVSPTRYYATATTSTCAVVQYLPREHQ